jgi:REP element-mobilizing transposase RayT
VLTTATIELAPLVAETEFRITFAAMDEAFTHYERNLPHRLPDGAVLFITYRLAGSLPREVSAGMAAEANMPAKAHKRAFAHYDEWLDGEPSGPHWLAQPKVAAIVETSIRFYAPAHYQLHAYCVMSNHVHMVISLPAALAKPFSQTLQAQKRYSATQANRLLGLSGQFWHRESYDHVIRSGAEFDRVVAYVVNNPVKAGLVTDWRDWPYTYWEQ